MNWDLIIKIYHIGFQVMCIAALSIGLVISACVLVHCLATKCWSADIKMPREWEKRDKAMAIKWGEEWEKMQQSKVKRKKQSRS